MGGGTAMRAASKVAGLGVGIGVHGGLRGAAPAVAPAEQAVRKSSIPVSAMLSSSSSASADVAPVQRPARELDGWVFAGGEDDLVMVAGEPMPRVVFAGVPSFDEAKEATVELKEALDKVYLSSPTSSESRELATYDQLSGLSLISKPEPEINSSLVVGTAPNSALKAFQLLSTNTQVQNVVASIASDQKVWDAVMENLEVQEFMKSNQKIVEFEEPVPEKSDDSSDSSKARQSGNWFTGMLGNIKLSVVELVSSLSSKLQNIFNFPSDAKDDANESHAFVLGASLIGLVTMVVMVVLLKRV